MPLAIRLPPDRTFDEYMMAWVDGIDLMNDVFSGYADP
jgi:hypothetical protein